MLPFKFMASFFPTSFYCMHICILVYSFKQPLLWDATKGKVCYSYTVFEGNKALTERDWGLREPSSAARQEAPSHNLQNHFLCHLSRNFLAHSSEHSSSECSLDIHKCSEENRVPCFSLEEPKLHVQGLQLPTPGKKIQSNHKWHCWLPTSTVSQG